MINLTKSEHISHAMYMLQWLGSFYVPFVTPTITFNRLSLWCGECISSATECSFLLEALMMHLVLANSSLSSYDFQWKIERKKKSLGTLEKLSTSSPCF